MIGLPKRVLPSLLVLGIAGAMFLSARHYIRSRVARPPTDAAQREALSNLVREVRGAVVYQRESETVPEGVYKTILGSHKAIRLTASGRYPRWSPDGRYVAFLRSNQVMRMTSWGVREQVLATAGKGRAVAYHPNGREILFTDAHGIKSVDIATRTVRTVVSNRVFVGLDISPDGRRLVAAVEGHRVLAYDLPNPEPRQLAIGCSVSLSPDGQRVLHNTGHHQLQEILDWASGTAVGSIPPPSGYQIDNNYWSNDPDWVALRSETPGDANVFVHQLSSGHSTRVTFTWDCNRPDLFVSHEPPGLLDRFLEWLFLL